MKTLSKSNSFYTTILNHFRKQYGDVVEITQFKITADNCITDSVDSFKTANII